MVALLHYMTAMAEYLAHLSWAQTALLINGWAVAIYYIVLLGACIYVWKVTGFRLGETNLVE